MIARVVALIVLLVGFAGSVAAETITATATPRAAQTMFSMTDAQNNNRAYSTLANACAARTARDNSQPVWTVGDSGNSCKCSGSGCPYSGYHSSVGTGSTCSADGQIWGQGCTDYSCPANQNWTISGTTCTRPDCVAPATRDPATGVCLSPCPGIQMRIDGVCSCANVESDTVKYRGISVGGSGEVPATHCYGNCSFADGAFSIKLGDTWAGELGKATGQTCSATAPNAKTPTADTRTPEQKCLASSGGFITTSSGTVCAGSADTLSPVTTVKKSETLKTEGGVTTTEVTTTTCQGAQCTTVVTSKDGAGVVVGTSTTTGAADGAGGGGGGDGEGECDKHPDTLGCAKFGDAVEGDALGTKEVGTSSVTPVSVSSNATCPPDVTIRTGVTLSYQHVCMYASALRPIILALAWLSVGYMIFGMRLE